MPAIRGDADGNEASVGEKELAEAGAVLVSRTAHGGVYGFDEVVEGCCGRASGDLWGIGGLSAEDWGSENDG